MTAAVYLFALTGKTRSTTTTSRRTTRTRGRSRTTAGPSTTRARATRCSSTRTCRRPTSPTKEAILQRKKSSGDEHRHLRLPPGARPVPRLHAPGFVPLGQQQPARRLSATRTTTWSSTGSSSPPSVASFDERAAGILHSFHGVNPMQLVYLTNMYADGGDACADETYHTWFRDKRPALGQRAHLRARARAGLRDGRPQQGLLQGPDPQEHACAQLARARPAPGKAYLDFNTGWEPREPLRQVVGAHRARHLLPGVVRAAALEVRGLTSRELAYEAAVSAKRKPRAAEARKPAKRAVKAKAAKKTPSKARTLVRAVGRAVARAVKKAKPALKRKKGDPAAVMDACCVLCPSRTSS